MVTSSSWVLLAYRIPREPSTPRIAVWRQLKRLGVAQIGDGLVGLPYDAVTKESLEWVAHTVFEAGGSASVWIADPAARRFGAELAAAMTADRVSEYAELLARLERPDELGTRGIKAIRAELRRIERRDYFPPPERAKVRVALTRVEARSDETETT